MNDSRKPEAPACNAATQPVVGIVGRLAAGPGQFEEAARVIHRSLAAWYERHLNQGERFGPDWQPFLIFPELYEDLDPGCAVTVRSPAGRLVGICFYHPRETHVSIGIVASDPESGGRGVAKAMVHEVLRLADECRLPARLVSSALNLDSFSLYTRMGFIPGQLFQDMQFPPGALPPAPQAAGIREAVETDTAAMADLECALTGIRREKDYAYFLKHKASGWHTMVQEAPDGKLLGFLCAVRKPGTHLIGPGITDGADSALNLLSAQLHRHPDSNPVFLVPARATTLVARLYAAGARNIELHLAQERPAGGAADTHTQSSAILRNGAIVLPTFLPESG